MIETYATPDEAARGDIPPRFASVASVVHSPDGRHAAVLLLTNEAPAVEPYLVVVSRTASDRWTQGAGAPVPGFGWMRADGRPDFGVWHLVREAPPGTTGVVLATSDDVTTLSVTCGYVFWARWGDWQDDFVKPHLIAWASDPDQIATP
jgi:hypothetical protein